MTNKALQEFKQIYRAEFGEELSDQEAMEKATKFLNLMRVIMRPIPVKTGGMGSQNTHKEV